MKKILLILGAALALSACNPTAAGPVSTPAEVSNRTAMDEQAAVSVELAYKAFRTALELAVDAGVLKGDNAVKAAKADQTAYNAILVMRAAYKTANSEDYLNAARSAKIAVEQALSTVRGL
jgi:hypothetical protein